MKATVFLISQWFRGHHAGGDDGLQDVHGVAFAKTAEEARQAVPSHRVHPIGDRSGQWGELLCEELGEIDVNDELPVFLEGL